MKRWAALGLIAASGLLPGSNGAVVGEYSSPAVKRALPNAPDGYTPKEVSCPGTRPSVRDASSLSSSETDWLKERRSKTVSAMKDFFGHVTIDGFDAASYIDSHTSNSSQLPNVGIAVSGGGYRALMNGAGALGAFDSRTPNSTTAGHLGGLLQSATYLSGLSGGGWLVGSIYMNNFSTVPSLQMKDHDSVWDFSNSILEGPSDGGIQILDTADYFKEIYDAVNGKDTAGFDVSITDFWGRALSYQLINDTEGGIAYTWSSIAQAQNFQNAEMPMPVLVADGRNPGERIIGTNATVFEFNPWEFGTFDPTVFGFVPMEFVGSRFVAGELPQNESCIRGFDNAGFVMGTSSSLFNQFILNLNSADVPDLLKNEIEKVLESIGKDDNDIAVYEPNPFYFYHNESSPFSDSIQLPLVDGGEDLQNVPLHPLIQPERGVDVIFAIDSSADNEFNWPNGTALVASYERSLNQSGIANGTAFPAIPDTNTFVNLGLNDKPTFFGCDASNQTGTGPLIVYIPNHPYVTWSNVSTFTMDYNDTQRNAIIQNGYDVATMGNGTRDSNWPACVGCAMLSRSFGRTNTDVPDVCQRCFDTYCWDGTLNSAPPATYAPTIELQEVNLQNGGSSLTDGGIFTVVAAVSVALFSLA